MPLISSDLGQAAHVRSHKEYTKPGPMLVVASQPSFLYFPRHTLGVLLLLLVVTLWVSTNFLTWSLFSHETYSKPYFVTYVNSGIFMVYLIPWIRREGISEFKSRWGDGERPWSLHNGEGFTRLGDDENDIFTEKPEKLGLFATIRLSAEIAILWWLANYFSYVCYVYTGAAGGAQPAVSLTFHQLCSALKILIIAVQVYGSSCSVLCFVLRDSLG